MPAVVPWHWVPAGGGGGRGGRRGGYYSMCVQYRTSGPPLPNIRTGTSRAYNDIEVPL